MNYYSNSILNILQNDLPGMDYYQWVARRDRKIKEKYSKPPRSKQTQDEALTNAQKKRELRNKKRLKFAKLCNKEEL